MLVNTFWKSMAAIEAFAGTDCELAVVAPEAAALLTGFRQARETLLVDVADSSESI